MSLSKAAEIKMVCPELCNLEHINQLLSYMMKHGMKHGILEELERLNFAKGGMLTYGDKPFNVFARIATGKLIQPGMEEETELLGEFKGQFMVACNRPENDAHWESKDEEWLGKASMSFIHRFLILRDLNWKKFNVICALLVTLQYEVDIKDLQEYITLFENMKSAAELYAKGKGIKELGLFFHVYGHSSVNSLHLHMVDLSQVGPTFEALAHKNLPLDVLLQFLKDKLKD